MSAIISSVLTETGVRINSNAARLNSWVARSKTGRDWIGTQDGSGGVSEERNQTTGGEDAKPSAADGEQAHLDSFHLCQGVSVVGGVYAPSVGPCSFTRDNSRYLASGPRP